MNSGSSAQAEQLGREVDAGHMVTSLPLPLQAPLRTSPVLTATWLGWPHQGLQASTLHP